VSAGSGITFNLPAEAVAELAERAAQLVLERIGSANGSPWMTRAQAAVYLGVPVSRLEKDRAVPCRRWDGRVLYHRPELDEWLEQFREGAA